jgi:hypothetical protein
MNTPSGKTGALNSRIDVRLRKIRSLKTSARTSPRIVLAMAAITVTARIAERDNDTADALTPQAEIDAGV